jgi:thiol:disulfide interchange protein DsbD
MRRLPALLITLAVLLFGARPGWGFDPERDVQVVLKKGAVVLTVPQGAHLKAAFMEIVLKKGTPGTLKVGPLPPTKEKDELGDGIWHDRVAIPVAGEGLKGDVELIVTYQPCTEGQGGACYPPTDVTLKVKAEAIPPVAAAKAAPLKAETSAAAEPAPIPAALPAAPAVQAPTATAPAPASDVSESLLVVFLGVFAAGLVASLTPCVYPMIPITMAIIGAKGGGKARGFSLSLMLVLGMAVTYTTLGVVAARTGAAFGAFAQRPAFLIPVSILFGLFALSLFGAFEIRLPDSIQQKLQGGGPRKGYTGAFIMGLVLGPLSAPCVGPVIGTVLLAIAQKGNVALGAAELFTFALGMGVLFLVTGTFSAALPRSGDWLEKLKHVMGLVVLGFAVWNLRLVVPQWLNFALWTVVLLAAAPILGAFQPAETLASGLRKGLGILALVLGILLGLRAVEANLRLELLPRGGAAAEAPKGPQTFLEQDYEGALAKAKAGGKLVLVDTYADWCAQCKELDEKTWPDAAVTAWIKANAIAVRINTDTVRKDLAPKLGIRSYPTVILLDGEGREVRRSMGFQEPKEMLAFLKK